MNDQAVIIGAGMAGLAAAIDLAARGVPVRVFERADTPGGKMRQVEAGPVRIDAGPTVFTMRWVFETLCADAGKSFDDYVSARPAELLARHAWDDRGYFDLFADPGRATDAVGDFFGAGEARGFGRFLKDAGAIHDTLKDTYMNAARPGPVELGQRVGIGNVGKLRRLRPFTTMWRALGDYFQDQRLRQLFGRYATYVGSSPYRAPATLVLIAHVECQGVWLVDGDMIGLASGLRRLAEDLGVEFEFGTGIDAVVIENGRARGVVTEAGERVAAAAVISNTDVNAFAAGHLGRDAAAAAPEVRTDERSLSAITWCAHARAKGFPLSRHAVFFSDDYEAEFEAIFADARVPTRPTTYICAQDRDDAGTGVGDGAPERLLILINAPAIGDRHTFSEAEIETCRTAMSTLLGRCGLSLDWSAATATTPSDFAALFPGSGGALYGRAQHGWTASFGRMGARSRIPGLYLAGGSVHPGAGVPMAALSGRRAAEAFMADRTSR